MQSTPTRRSRHRKGNNNRSWIVTLLVLLLAGTIGFGIFIKGFPGKDPDVADDLNENNELINGNNGENGNSDPEPDSEPDPEPELEETFTEITLAVAGDIRAHSPQIKRARENCGDHYDFKPMFEDVRPILSAADMTIANFETTTAGPEREYTGYPMFNSPDSLIDAILYAGVDVLTTANNHSLDTRDTGLIRTVEQIRKRGIDTVGTYVDGNEDRILIKEVEGIKFAILSYTETTNGLGDQYDPAYLNSILNLMTKENISRDIQAAKAAEVDFIITYMHWGQEYMTEPNETQIDYAQFMANEGVDLILGSHPHVIQRTDVIEAEDGREVFVVYSLGNFISNQRQETLGDGYALTEDGLIINFDIRKNDLTGETLITDVEYIPTWVYRNLDAGRSTFNYRILPVQSFLLKDEISEVYKKRMERSYESTISKMYDFPAVEQ